MPGFKVGKVFRIDPETIIESTTEDGRTVVSEPAAFVTSLRPGYGVVAASWDDDLGLGCVSRYGIVVAARGETATIKWVIAEATYRPNPQGRRWWKQAKPFFGFAPDVVDRYMLAGTFADLFPNDVEITPMSPRPADRREIRPSDCPTGGYVYLVRSQYGIKIGKSVNVRNRTRLFEVKLPFPISVEHYAWFDDYSLAERSLHRQYHAKRMEGEWFNLSDADVAHIKTLGQSVPVAGL